jgi:single-strand DNA-binding protein
MNQLMTIIGNLTKDPELRVTPTGKTVCNFTVAVNYFARKRQADGSYENVKNAAYYRVSTWGSDAERCGKYLVKGRKVCVHGELTNVSIALDANGEPIYRKDANGKPTKEQLINLEISAEGSTSFLSNTSPDETAGNTPQAQESAPAAAPVATDPSGATPVSVPDDELPF